MYSPAASSTLRASKRSSSTAGTFTSRRVSLICAKIGDSMIRSRMNKPTNTSTMLTKNGTRQPHDKKSSSGSWLHEQEHAVGHQPADRAAHLRKAAEEASPLAAASARWPSAPRRPTRRRPRGPARSAARPSVSAPTRRWWRRSASIPSGTSRGPSSSTSARASSCDRSGRRCGRTPGRRPAARRTRPRTRRTRRACRPARRRLGRTGGRTRAPTRSRRRRSRTTRRTFRPCSRARLAARTRAAPNRSALSASLRPRPAARVSLRRLASSRRAPCALGFLLRRSALLRPFDAALCRTGPTGRAGFAPADFARGAEAAATEPASRG